MKITGAEVRGNEVILVTLHRDKDGSILVQPDACTRIALSDGHSQAAVRDFARAVAAFVRNHNIEKVIIRGRNTGGQFAGGANSFKIEGLIQCIDSFPVEILMPQSIAATERKHKIPTPSELHKYRLNAFTCAYASIIREHA